MRIVAQIVAALAIPIVISAFFNANQIASNSCDLHLCLSQGVSIQTDTSKSTDETTW